MFFSVLVRKSEVPRLNSHPWRSRPGWEEISAGVSLRGRSPDSAQLASLREPDAQDQTGPQAPQAAQIAEHEVLQTACQTDCLQPLSHRGGLHWGIDRELSKTTKCPSLSGTCLGKGPLWLQSMAEQPSMVFQGPLMPGNRDQGQLAAAVAECGGLCRASSALTVLIQWSHKEMWRLNCHKCYKREIQAALQFANGGSGPD